MELGKVSVFNTHQAGAAEKDFIILKAQRRKPFIILALLGTAFGLLGMSFAAHYGYLLLSGFVFGFSLLNAGPIGFQYGAELTCPGPEGTSNGLLILAGQISGIIFIFAVFLSFLLSFKLRESALLSQNG